jgi:hypothetical protein
MTSSFRPGAATRRAGYLVRCAVLPLGVCLLGCNRKDPAECATALQTVTQSLANADFVSARTWRDYAYKQCDDPAALQALDQQILQKQTETSHRKLEEKQRREQTDQLVKVLVDWGGEHRGVPERASAAPRCDELPEKTPKDKQLDRWCVGTRQAGPSFTLEVRYWDADREAVRFSTVAPEPVGCDALGAHRIVRSWQTQAKGGGTATRVHCELTGGRLAGFQALVAQASNAPVYIFSPKYLELDAAMKGILGN